MYMLCCSPVRQAPRKADKCRKLQSVIHSEDILCFKSTKQLLQSHNHKYTSSKIHGSPNRSE